MATKNGIKKPTMTPQKARDVLQSILDNRKEIATKSVTQANAMHIAAMILEQANADGAGLIHEEGILKYHASNIDATLFCDKYTRRALEAGIRQINKHISAREGGENV